MSHIPYLELSFNSWYGYKLQVNDNFLRVQAFFTGWQLLSQYLVWPQRQCVAIVSNSILILNCFQGSWLRNCLSVSVVAIENEDYSFQREINREILTRIKLMCWKCLNTLVTHSSFVTFLLSYLPKTKIVYIWPPLKKSISILIIWKGEALPQLAISLTFLYNEGTYHHPLTVLRCSDYFLEFHIYNMNELKRYQYWWNFTSTFPSASVSLISLLMGILTGTLALKKRGLRLWPR